jgi:phosphoribosylformylglycinamidine cyclo-ligase
VLPRTGDMAKGDVLIGIASSGPHSNGYSLIRRIVAREGLFYGGPSPFSKDQTLGEALLTPTRLYAHIVLPLIRSGRIKGLAHITGGGLTENTPRMCPDHLMPRIDRASWTPPPVFKWLQEAGGVDTDEMHRTFNMGIGMVLAVSPADAASVIADLKAAGEDPRVVGEFAPA